MNPLMTCLVHFGERDEFLTSPLPFQGLLSKRQGRRVPIRHSPQRAAQNKARRTDFVHAEVRETGVRLNVGEECCRVFSF